MTRPSRPEVSDPELRAALDGVGDHIENYNANLDAISNDIKKIEQYLIASGIRLVAGVTVSQSEEFTDGDYDVMRNYSGGIQRDVDWIEWAPVDESGKRWRLMYKQFCRFGEIDICEGIAMAGPTFTGPTRQLDRRPLIEAPVTIRLQAHKKLAQLVKELGELVKVQPLPDVPPNENTPS